MRKEENSETTRAAAEMVSIDKLLPWVKNPRKNDKAIKKIADSIREFGFASPIIARLENGEVIAGHTRLKAAKMLGLKEVPVRYLDIDERKAHLLALADNKLGEISEWDEVQLSELLGDFNFQELEIAGWGYKELGELAKEFDKESLVEAKERLSGRLVYSVVLECNDEAHQIELLERFDGEGFKCKPLIN